MAIFGEGVTPEGADYKSVIGFFILGKIRRACPHPSENGHSSAGMTPSPNVSMVHKINILIY